MLIRATVSYSPLEAEIGGYEKQEATLGDYRVVEVDNVAYRKLDVSGLYANWNSINQLPKDIMPLSDLVGVVPHKVITDTLNLVDPPVGFYRTWAEAETSTFAVADTTWFAVHNKVPDRLNLIEDVNKVSSKPHTDQLPLLSSTALRFSHSVIDELVLQEHVLPSRMKLATIALLEDINLSVHSSALDPLQFDSSIGKKLLRGIGDSAAFSDEAKLRLSFAIEDNLRVLDDLTHVRGRIFSSTFNASDSLSRSVNPSYTDEAKLSSVVTNDLDGGAVNSIGLGDDPIKRLTRAVVETILLTDVTDNIRRAETADSTVFQDSYELLTSKVLPEYLVLAEELGKTFIKDTINETAQLIEAVNKGIKVNRESATDLTDAVDVRYQGNKDSTVTFSHNLIFSQHKQLVDTVSLGSHTAIRKGESASNSLTYTDSVSARTLKYPQDQVSIGDSFQYALGSGGSILNSAPLNSSTLG